MTLLDVIKSVSNDKFRYANDVNSCYSDKGLSAGWFKAEDYEILNDLKSNKFKKNYNAVECVVDVLTNILEDKQDELMIDLSYREKNLFKKSSIPKLKFLMKGEGELIKAMKYSINNYNKDKNKLLNDGLADLLSIAQHVYWAEWVENHEVERLERESTKAQWVPYSQLSEEEKLKNFIAIPVLDRILSQYESSEVKIKYKNLSKKVENIFPSDRV